MCFSSYRNRKLKVKLWRVASLQKKKEGIFCTVYFVWREFCQELCFISMYNIEYTFRIYILLHIKKHYFIHFCCLLLKSSKAFSVSLTWPANDITDSTGAGIFTVIDTKIYVTIITLSIQVNKKLSQQLKWGFKCLV